MWTRNSSWHSISPSSGHHRRGASPYIEPSYSNTDSSYPRLSIYTCNLAEVTGRGDHGRALPRHRNATDCNGKEKDYESGFHYYGARYYWSELLTGWLSVDPMSDKYPSMSPYNYCAWNPIILVDPDGREIDPSGIFDQNGDAKKGCEFACKAFLFFAQTRYGQKTLARFAKKGQTIAGHTYTTDGDYHKEGIDLGFRVGKLRNGSSASGETGYDITGSDNSGRMRLTISLCNPVVACDDDNIAGFLQTICHEMYFHAYNYAADFMDDRTINDSEISSYLKEGRNYTSRNMWHEVQDLRHNHAYRNNAIPIMSEFFGKTKTRAETIEWMSKQGRYFKHCKNWHKK